MLALPIIKEIVVKNIEFDMVTIQAAIAYLRMTRENISNVNPIISMLEILDTLLEKVSFLA